MVPVTFAVGSSVPSVPKPIRVAGPLSVAVTLKVPLTIEFSVGEVIVTPSVPPPPPPPPPMPASMAAFGVPYPVGPSQPVVALHRMLPHEPLVPDVTSNSDAVLPAICAAVALPWPVAAKIAATIGAAALVPPITSQPPLAEL